jgi:hypothetical protein
MEVCQNDDGLIAHTCQKFKHLQQHLGQYGSDIEAALAGPQWVENLACYLILSFRVDLKAKQAYPTNIQQNYVKNFPTRTI